MLQRCLFFLLLSASFLRVQAQNVANDTTVYQTADIWAYPLLNSCSAEKHPGWTEDSVRHCAETQLLGIMARNVRYPQEARDKNIQGTVVTSFIVEKDGRATNHKIIKDIGGGCGPEAIRVLKALDTLGLRFKPAQKNGKEVRMQLTLPLRFKLQDAIPYYLNQEGDTIYVQYDKDPAFKKGMDSLAYFAINRLDYPKQYRDSCKTGIIEMSLLIGRYGQVKVENQLDFSNLGFDFQYEAIRMANKTAGMWEPAVYKDKPVITSLPLRAVFKSDASGCTAINEKFDRAILLSDEGAQLYDSGKTDEAVAKWTESLRLYPNNTEVLYYRGTAYLNTNKKEEACTDFNKVKDILGVTWFENVRRLVCGW